MAKNKENTGSLMQTPCTVNSYIIVFREGEMTSFDISYAPRKSRVNYYLLEIAA